MDVAHALGASIIIAVDVSAYFDSSPVQYEDAVSGWWILFQKWILGRKITIPSMEEIQNRLVYVTCDMNNKDQMNRFIMSHPGQHRYYIRPDGVSKYGTTEFGSFQSIVQDGYNYGRMIVQKWKQQESLVFGQDKKGTSYFSSSGHNRRYSL